MDTNTLLRIYQTYSLEKISALSKQSLAAQYAQNEQLVQLNKELAVNNAIANKILRNQISELERQEKGRFYKNMIFNLKLVVDKIENLSNVNFKLFLSSLFLKPVIAYSKEAITNLEEITDKEYAQEILERANSISLSNQSHMDDYYRSVWSLYLPTKKAYESKEFNISIDKNKNEIERIEEEKQALLKEINKIEKAKSEKIKSEKFDEDAFFGWGVIFLVFAIGRQIYLYIKDSADTKSFIVLLGIAVILIVIGLNRIAREGSKRHSSYFESIKEYMRGHRDKNTPEYKEKEKEINQKFDKQKEPYLVKIDELNHKIKGLDKEIEELKIKDKENEESFASISEKMIEDCPEWEDKTNEILELLPHIKEEHFDPKIREIASYVIAKNCFTVSLIQRKYAIGYSRANRIADQLLKLRIIAKVNKSDYEVICKNEKDLIKILE